MKVRAREPVVRDQWPFDKYKTYRTAVQSPEVDVVFLRKVFRELRGRPAQSLREDFCGTFAISCEWAKLSQSHLSFGIDIDPEPLAYGLEHHHAVLAPTTRSRVKVFQKSVLEPDLPLVDLVCAMNFSYFCFKSRALLKQYFKNVYSTLKPEGIFVADAFGGPACQQANVEESGRKGFRYVWEQVSYEPLTHEAVFQIHFKFKNPKGRYKTYREVFTYDWRMWSIPELREVMEEVGFRKTHVYWEGTTRSGTGDGIFKRVEKGEECEAWVAYVVGEK